MAPQGRNAGAEQHEQHEQHEQRDDPGGRRPRPVGRDGHLAAAPSRPARRARLVAPLVAPGSPVPVLTSPPRDRRPGCHSIRPVREPDRVSDWVALVDACYPVADAEEWDAVGLHVGDSGDPVGTVLLCLDVTPETLAEAERSGAELVLAHHPLLFRPLSRLTPDTAGGALALRAARSRIAVLAAHTNVDVAEPGTTDPVVDLLGLRDVRPLAPTPAAARVKLVTFVPSEHTAAVLTALAGAGAGVIGEYDHCSFRVAGTGTFRPSAAARPALGRRGELNEVAEDRLELVLSAAATRPAVEALLDAHPYEEVAYDLVPLVPEPAGGKGLGRVGDLARPQPLRELAARLAEGLPSRFLRLAGNPDRLVRRVAACGGAGESLLDAARDAGAELYVSGDLRHHATLDALATGMAVIDAGHYATEAAALPAVERRLRTEAGRRGLRARLLPSAERTEPWSDWAAPAVLEGEPPPGPADDEGKGAP